MLILSKLAEEMPYVARRSTDLVRGDISRRARHPTNQIFRVTFMKNRVSRV